MIRTLLTTLALALHVLAEDPKPPTPDKDDAKQAVLDAIAKTKEKSHKFTAQTDVEAGGSPMMSSETKGTFVKPYAFISMDMMGRQIETYSDGTSTVSKDRAGEWTRREGAGGQRGLSLDMLTGAIKSASWDDEEKKVGSHVCRVAKLKVDTEKLAGVGLGGRRGGGGGQGGGNAVNKASIRVYVDKEDGKLRRLKATLAVSANFQGQAMDLDIVLDTRYTYSSKLTLELPAEVKELFEQKPEEKKPEEEPPKAEEPKKDEGSGK